MVASFCYSWSLREVNDFPKAAEVVIGESVFGCRSDSEAHAINYLASQILLKHCFYYCGPRGIKFFRIELGSSCQDTCLM